MAASKCTACASERRTEIDVAIVSLASVRNIGREFGLSKDAVARHKKHIGQAIVVAATARGEHLGATLLDKINRMEQDLQRLAARAEHEGDVRAAIMAQNQLGNVVKLRSELTPVESGDREQVIRFVYACPKCGFDNGWRTTSPGESHPREVQPPAPEVAW